MSFPLPDDEDDDEDDGSHGMEVQGSWTKVASLWPGDRSMGADRWGTRLGGLAHAGAGAAASVAKNAAFGGIAGKIGLGAAASALTVGTGGVAVVAVAGVMQVGSMALSARSASKTWDHMKALKTIGAQKNYACRCLGPIAGTDVADHGHILRCVIPYIINKKSAKLVKKGVGTVGLGIGTTIFSIGKKAYKAARGTLGKRRTFYAQVVARHMVTHDCKLCEALVGELFSPSDYLRLRTMNSEDAGGWIARKMKSN